MFIFKVTPIGKPRMTRADAWKERAAVQRYWNFKSDIQKRALEGGFKLQNILDVIFLLPMPDSWSMKKKIAMKGTPHLQKPDKDNLEKALLDSLTVDDSKVWDGRVRKYWYTEGMVIILNNDITENADAPLFDFDLMHEWKLKTGFTLLPERRTIEPVRDNDIV